MTRNRLLIAAAIAALTVGSGSALAQSPDQVKKPAEKSAPSTMKSTNDNKGAENKAGEQKNQPAAAQKAEDKNKASAQKADEKSKPSPSTAGQAPSQSQMQKPADQKAQQKPSDQKAQQKPSEQNKMQNRSTTGQGTPSTTQQPSTGQTPTQRGTTTAPSTNPSGQTGGAVTGQSGSSTTNVNVNLNPEQRTRIREVIVKERSAPRVASVEFQLSVGTVVPRGKVKLVALPLTIVEIQPAWRGYEYFLVGDEIVIVDPRTLRIVAVIPA